MDNRTVDVVSEGDRDLALALELVWPNAAGNRATHYKIGKYRLQENGYVLDERKGVHTLILFWAFEEGASPLPYPYDLKQAIDFVIGWLKHVDYGLEPDHDGSNRKGWHVFTDKHWGNAFGSQYGIIAIQPEWAMYGK